MRRELPRVVLGGTFDRLHLGHQALLNTALHADGAVAIGLTTDAYLRSHPKPDGHRIRSYSSRRRALRAWLRRTAPLGRWSIVPLNDPFGRSILPRTRVLVASVETRRGAAAVNRVRRRRGLRPLRTILVPLVLADDLQPITSTRVRAGVIDRHGRRLSPIRLALWSSEKELVRPFRTAVRATFPRGRLSVRTMRPEGSIPPARQVRSWSRAALSGHDLAFAVLVAPGPRRDALFSERSNTVELYPKRLPRSRGLKVRDWTFLLRPRARRQGSGRGAPKG